MSSAQDFRLDPSVSPRLTAVEMVHGILRAAILRGDLPGESRLVQTEIATQLGVSTTPVREAMRGLASEGLITLDSHRIGTVRTPERKEMLEIVEIRHSVERVAIERAMANITTAEKGQAKVLAQELTEEDDLGSWVEKNIEFHTVFHNATRTVRLKGILVSLEEAAGVFVAQAHRLQPEIRRRAVEEHVALLEAFEGGDVDRAVEIGHSHVSLPLEAFELGDAR